AVLKLEISRTHRFEVSFKAHAPSQIVIGSALSPAPFVSLRTALDQPIDVLVDLTLLSVEVTRISEINTTTVTTETYDLDSKGHPVKTIETSVVEAVTEHPLTQQSAATHVPLVAEALRRGYAQRTV